MLLYVAMLLLVHQVIGPPPLRLTIDCPEQRGTKYNSLLRSSDCTFCNLIHNALPKAVRDGKFIQIPTEDQTGYSDTQAPISIAAPKGFLPKLTNLKLPKIRLSKLNVPKLQERTGLKAPRVSTSHISSYIPQENSSAERIEKFKKGVQKMLHFVKVLGQIDHYLSERVRIVVDKVSKTIAE